MKLSFAAFATVVLSVAASAQVTQVGPFTGTMSENFDSGPQAIFIPCMPYRVFNNNADMCTPNGGGCHTTGGWAYICQIPNYSPPLFFGSVNGPVEISFDNAISRFGGFFGKNSGIADGTVDFYDAAGALIGSDTVSAAADCQWHWNGWQITGAVRKVTLTGIGSGGAYLMMDSLEADGGVIPPPPTAYCTAGTSTNGCIPEISGTGTPSVAATSGFTIDVSDLEGQQSGLIFYGINGRVAYAWGLSTSFYCVKSPVERMGVLNSGGTIGLCDGSFSIDWLAFVAGNPSALGVPFSAGDVVNAQGWYRDPPSPKTTNLSDGLEFTLVP